MTSRAARGMPLLLLLCSGCIYAPHEHIGMVPGREPQVFDGSEFPRGAEFADQMLDGHLVVMVVEGREATVYGGPPPFVLRLTVFAPHSPYDSLRIDSITVRSSFDSVSALLRGDDFPVMRPMYGDYPRAPRQGAGCSADCAQERARYTSAPVLMPNFATGDQLNISAHLSLLSGARAFSGVVHKEFRTSIRRHLFEWIRV